MGDKHLRSQDGEGGRMATVCRNQAMVTDGLASRRDRSCSTAFRMEQGLLKCQFAPNNNYLGGFKKFDTLKRKMIRTDRGEKYLLGEDYLKVWTWEKFKNLAVQAQKWLNLAF